MGAGGPMWFHCRVSATVVGSPLWLLSNSLSLLWVITFVIVLSVVLKIGLALALWLPLSYLYKHVCGT